MRRIVRTLLPAVGLTLAGSLVGATAEAQSTAYGLTTGAGGQQQLVRFDVGSPSAVTTLGFTGASLLGLDFRPFNGTLYGYDGDRLFTINTATGAATQLFDIANTTGGAAGVDFNPAADRLRLTDAAGNNYRVNPADGTTVVDSSLAYTTTDAFAGQTPSVTAVAYTNNDNDPATATALYGVDAARGNLVLINPPNNGRLNTVGGLGLGATPNVVGFDVVTVGGVNSAFLTVLGVGSVPVTSLYRVNLASGATSLVGSVGAAGAVRGLAIVPAVTAVPEPGTLGLVAAGAALGGGLLRRRRRSA